MLSLESVCGTMILKWCFVNNDRHLMLDPFPRRNTWKLPFAHIFELYKIHSEERTSHHQSSYLFISHQSSLSHLFLYTTTMATKVMSYLGFRAGPTPPTSPTEIKTQTQTNNAVRALPASWYNSQEMYSLERRAIYSRKWLLTTHKLRWDTSSIFSTSIL